MDCSVCGAPSGLDPLCGSHKRVLSTCSDLTPEQIRTRLPPDPQVALIDMFGAAHPLPEMARIGRDPATCDLAVLHASVSSQHTALSIAGGIVTIADLGSLNGTFVDDQRIGQTSMPARELLLRVGVVSFMLCPDVLGPVGPAPLVRRTVPRGSKKAQVAFVAHGTRWELTVTGEAASLAGDKGEIGLSLMEGRLLRVLLDRSADPAYLASGELVHELGFGARAADSENVRELVRRLRRKLEAFGMGDLIESRRNAGYRIAPHARRV